MKVHLIPSSIFLTLGTITDLAWSPDSKYLATSAADSIVRVFTTKIANWFRVTWISEGCVHCFVLWLINLSLCMCMGLICAFRIPPKRILKSRKWLWTLLKRKFRSQAKYAPHLLTKDVLYETLCDGNQRSEPREDNVLRRNSIWRGTQSIIQLPQRPVHTKNRYEIHGPLQEDPVKFRSAIAGLNFQNDSDNISLLEAILEKVTIGKRLNAFHEFMSEVSRSAGRMDQIQVHWFSNTLIPRSDITTEIFQR